MPISNDEFEAGTVEEDDEEDEVEPEAVEGGDDTDTETSPIEDEKELITTFLSERHDLTGTVGATAIVVNDVDEALAELVEEGTVETKEVDTDGGTTVYYRLAE